MKDMPDTMYDYRPEQDDAKVFCDCDWCGEEIFVGDDFYRINHERVCETCISESRELAE